MGLLFVDVDDGGGGAGRRGGGGPGTLASDG